MENLRQLERVKAYRFPGFGERRFIPEEFEIYQTVDNKAVFILQNGEAVVYLPTRVAVNVYYEYKKAEFPREIKGVLMDLDGTSVKSEEFWIGVIEEIARFFLGNKKFKFSAADRPYVSGFSVSEHLAYILEKYCRN